MRPLSGPANGQQREEAMGYKRTCSEKVKLGVCCDDPEPIMFPPEGLDGGSLRQIPHTNSSIVSARQDQFVFGMEESARDVVEMAATRVDPPSIGLAHPPNLDDSVVCSRHDKGEG
jgi:hypothetical protein